MNTELQNLLLRWNLEPSLAITLAAGGCALLFFVSFLVARLAWDRRRQRRDRLRAAIEEGLRSSFSLDLPADLPNVGWQARWDVRFDRAAMGTGWELTGAHWLGLMILLGLAAGAGIYLWDGGLEQATAGVVVGCLLPGLVLFLMRHRVRSQMRQQLPDALYFLARSLRAGLSFEQALALVAQESPKPLATELRRCVEQLSLGLAPHVALARAAERIQLPDFDALVAAISLHATMGGNLAMLLDRLAHATRDRNQYLGYFRSATALGRATAIAIGSAAPLLFFGYLLFQPEYAARFLESSTGLMLLGTAFGLELVGVVWLWWLLRVEY